MTRVLPATALVLLAGTGALAIAAGDAAKIKAGQFTVGGFNHAEGYAKCGKGKRALGGGVVQSSAADVLQVHASGPLDATGVTLNTDTGDPAKQWYAAVVNGSNSERTFRVFAICSADSKATIRSSLFIADEQTTGEGYASCGRRKRALGGGVVPIGSADNLAVRASGPLDASGVTLNTDTGDTATQWYAAVFNSSGFQRVLRVFAICE